MLKYLNLQLYKFQDQEKEADNIEREKNLLNLSNLEKLEKVTQISEIV